MTNQRVLTVPGGINFRELGGYSTKDGRKIKWHKVIRTGGLDQLTPAGQALLDDYGVRYDIDFRSPQEVLDAPDRILPMLSTCTHQCSMWTKRGILTVLTR